MICDRCALWVETETGHGFCVVRDLFTYTNESECEGFIEGKPSTIEEWEKAQEKWLGELRK